MKARDLRSTTASNNLSLSWINWYNMYVSFFNLLYAKGTCQVIYIHFNVHPVLVGFKMPFDFSIFFHCTFQNIYINFISKGCATSIYSKC